jgi:hypothetical protein
MKRKTSGRAKSNGRSHQRGEAGEGGVKEWEEAKWCEEEEEEEEEQMKLGRRGGRLKAVKGGWS